MIVIVFYHSKVVSMPVS